MNKLFTKIVGAALGATMAIGVGVAVASNSRDVAKVEAADSTYTLGTIPTKGWSASGGTQTMNGVTWTYDSGTFVGQSNGKIQVGSGSKPQTSAWHIKTPVSSFGSGKVVKSITLSAYTTVTTATYDISAGGSSVKSGSLTTSTDNYIASNLNISSGNIDFTLQGSSSSKAMYITGISITYGDAQKTLSSIELDTSSVQKQFDINETFNHTGMTVTANYEGGSTADVTSSATWSSPDMSTAGTKTVTVSYTEGTTKTATYEITVSTPKTLTGIEITHAPNKTTYLEGESFDPTGMIVFASFDGASSENVTSYCTFTPSSSLSTTDKSVTVSYTYKTVTKQASQTIRVKSASIMWVETELEDLSSDDVFVIVGNNGGNYAMTNDNGTSSAPAVSEVTVSNGKITSTVSDNIKWNLSSSNDGYSFYPNGVTDSWLYCTATNNGVRVGTNNNNVFTINNDYLYNTATERYLGIYSSQDWRCYTSNGGNIADQTFAFYKYVSSSTPDVTGISVNDGVNDHDSNFSLELYENHDGQFIATVLPEGAEQGVNWTYTGNVYCNDDGSFLLGSYSDGTSATITATSIGEKQDGTHASITATITILEDARVLDHIAINGDWTSKQYYHGDSWETSSLTFKAVFEGGQEEDITLGAELDVGFYLEESMETSSNTAVTGMTSVWAYALYNGTYGEAEGLQELTFPTVLAVIATYTRTAPSKTSFTANNTFTFGGTITETWNNDPEHPNTYTEADSEVSFELQKSDKTKVTDISVGDPMLVDYDGLYVVVKCKDNPVGSRYSITVSEAFNKSNGEFHVADADDIVPGAYIVIAAAEYDVVMADYADGNNFPQGDGAKNSSKGIVTKTNATVLEIVDGYTSGTFAMKTEEGTYLNAAGGTGSSPKNQLKTTDTIKNSSSFNFTKVSDNDWTIVASGGAARDTIRYNSNASGGHLFSCYASGGQSPITVYVFESYKDEAYAFADEFTKGLANACKDQNANNKAAVEALWTTYKNKFEALTDSSVNSTNNAQKVFGDSLDEKIVQARKLYLHIIARYKLATWNGAPQSSSLNVINRIVVDTPAIAVIIVTSAIALTAIGGYFFIRRRKHN